MLLVLLILLQAARALVPVPARLEVRLRAKVREETARAMRSAQGWREIQSLWAGAGVAGLGWGTGASGRGPVTGTAGQV